MPEASACLVRGLRRRRGPALRHGRSGRLRLLEPAAHSRVRCPPCNLEAASSGRCDRLDPIQVATQSDSGPRRASCIVHCKTLTRLSAGAGQGKQLTTAYHDCRSRPRAAGVMHAYGAAGWERRYGRRAQAAPPAVVSVARVRSDTECARRGSCVAPARGAPNFPPLCYFRGPPRLRCTAPQPASHYDGQVRAQAGAGAD
jgi:hypothetical protein